MATALVGPPNARAACDWSLCFGTVHWVFASSSSRLAILDSSLHLVAQLDLATHRHTSTASPKPDLSSHKSRTASPGPSSRVPLASSPSPSSPFPSSWRREGVVAVSWHIHSGLLAVAIGAGVLVLAPVKHEDHALGEWTEVSLFHVEGTVRDVEWVAVDRLVVATSRTLSSWLLRAPGAHGLGHDDAREGAGVRPQVPDGTLSPQVLWTHDLFAWDGRLEHIIPSPVADCLATCRPISQKDPTALAFSQRVRVWLTPSLDNVQQELRRRLSTGGGRARSQSVTHPQVPTYWDLRHPAPVLLAAWNPASHYGPPAGTSPGGVGQGAGSAGAPEESVFPALADMEGAEELASLSLMTLAADGVVRLWRYTHVAAHAEQETQQAAAVEPLLQQIRERQRLERVRRRRDALARSRTSSSHSPSPSDTGSLGKPVRATSMGGSGNSSDDDHSDADVTDLNELLDEASLKKLLDTRDPTENQSHGYWFVALEIRAGAEVGAEDAAGNAVPATYIGCTWISASDAYGAGRPHNDTLAAKREAQQHVHAAPSSKSAPHSVDQQQGAFYVQAQRRRHAWIVTFDSRGTATVWCIHDLFGDPHNPSPQAVRLATVPHSIRPRAMTSLPVQAPGEQLATPSLLKMPALEYHLDGFSHATFLASRFSPRFAWEHSDRASTAASDWLPSSISVHVLTAQRTLVGLSLNLTHDHPTSERRSLVPVSANSASVSMGTVFDSKRGLPSFSNSAVARAAPRTLPIVPDSTWSGRLLGSHGGHLRPERIAQFVTHPLTLPYCASLSADDGSVVIWRLSAGHAVKFDPPRFEFRTRLLASDYAPSVRGEQYEAIVWAATSLPLLLCATRTRIDAFRFVVSSRRRSPHHSWRLHITIPVPNPDGVPIHSLDIVRSRLDVDEEDDDRIDEEDDEEEHSMPSTATRMDESHQHTSSSATSVPVNIRPQRSRSPSSRARKATSAKTPKKRPSTFFLIVSIGDRLLVWDWSGYRSDASSRANSPALVTPSPSRTPPSTSAGASSGGDSSWRMSYLSRLRPSPHKNLSSSPVANKPSSRFLKQAAPEPVLLTDKWEPLGDLEDSHVTCVGSLPLQDSELGNALLLVGSSTGHVLLYELALGADVAAPTGRTRLTHKLLCTVRSQSEAIASLFFFGAHRFATTDASGYLTVWQAESSLQYFRDEYAAQLGLDSDGSPCAVVPLNLGDGILRLISADTSLDQLDLVRNVSGASFSSSTPELGVGGHKPKLLTLHTYAPGLPGVPWQRIGLELPSLAATLAQLSPTCPSLVSATLTPSSSSIQHLAAHGQLGLVCLAEDSLHFVETERLIADTEGLWPRPGYHPARLTENLLAGEFARVKNVLSWLYQHLVVRGTSPAHILPPPLPSILAEASDVPLEPVEEDEHALGQTSQSAGGGFDMSSFGSFGGAAARSQPAASSGGFDMSSFGSFGSAAAMPQPAASGGFDMSSFGSFGGATTRTQPAPAASSGGFDMSSFGNFGAAAASGSGASATTPQSTTTSVTTTKKKKKLNLRVWSAPKRDDVTVEQLGELSEALMNGPLLPLLSPGLNLQLLAVVDTVAKTLEESANNMLGEFGQRFITAVHVFNFCRASIPTTSPLCPERLAPKDIAFVMHASHATQRALIELCFGVGQASVPMSAATSSASAGTASLPLPLTWSMLNALGVGYWLHDYKLLEKLMLKVAMEQYKVDRNPKDCMLLFIALGKKRVLLGLIKSDQRLQQVWKFLSNDFSQPRWQQAAFRNAFRAVSQKKFESAAAFFLLGGNLRDAVSICVRDLNDVQLALVIIRLFERRSGNGVGMAASAQLAEESEAYENVLSDRLLGIARRRGDRYLQHIGLVLLGRVDEAIRFLVGEADWIARRGSVDELPELLAAAAHDVDAGSTLDSVPETPYLLRLLATSRSPHLLQVHVSEKLLQTAYFESAHCYARIGCPLLALQHLEAGLALLADEDEQEDEQPQTRSSRAGLDLPLHEVVGPDDAVSVSEASHAPSSLQREHDDPFESSMGQDAQRLREVVWKSFRVSLVEMLLSSRVLFYKDPLQVGEEDERDGDPWERAVVFSPELARAPERCSLLQQDIDELFASLASASQRVNEEASGFFRTAFNVASGRNLFDVTLSLRLAEGELSKVEGFVRNEMRSLTALLHHEDLLHASPALQRRLNDSWRLYLSIRDRLLPEAYFSRSEMNVSASRCVGVAPGGGDMGGDMNVEPLRSLWDLLNALIHSTFMLSALARNDMHDVRVALLLNLLEPFTLAKAKATSQTPHASKDVDDFASDDEDGDARGMGAEEDARSVRERAALLESDGSLAGEQVAFVTRLSAYLILQRFTETFVQVYAAEVWTPAVTSSLTGSFEQSTGNLHSYGGRRASRAFQPSTQVVSSSRSIVVILQLVAALRVSLGNMAAGLWRGFRSVLQLLVVERRKHEAEEDARLAEFREWLADADDRSDHEDGEEDGFVERAFPLARLLRPLNGAVPSGNADSSDVWLIVKGGHSLGLLQSEVEQYLKFIFEEPGELFHRPLEVFREQAKGTLPRAIAVNALDDRWLAVATVRGVRETNVDGSLRYRPRSEDQAELKDDEYHEWQGCYHRFDGLDSGVPQPTDGVVFPSPLLRLLFVLDPTPLNTLSRHHDHMLRNDPRDLVKLAANKSFRSFLQRDGNAREAAVPAAQVDRDTIVTSLAAHPTLPVYLSGGMDGRVLLWEFGNPHALAAFATAVAPSSIETGYSVDGRAADADGVAGGASGGATGGHQMRIMSPSAGAGPPVRIKRIRFDPSGDRFGVLTSTGVLLLYAFVYNPNRAVKAPLRTVVPFEAIQCHKVGQDFVFLPNGRVATAGQSDHQRNVRVWDLLACGDERLVSAYKCPHGDTTALCYIPRDEILVGGTSKGCLFVMSLKWGSIMIHKNDEAHSGRVYVLRYDPFSHSVVSGGQDGLVRRWSASTYSLKSSMRVYEKKSFFNHPSCHDMMSSFGVTDLAITSKYMLCSGSDGSVRYFKRKA